jgi:hypothetical protein
MLDQSSSKVYLKTMNKLGTDKRAQILGMMVEGVSIRAIARMTNACQHRSEGTSHSRAKIHQFEGGSAW